MVAYRPFLIPVLTDGSVGRRDAAQRRHRKMGSSRVLCLGCLALLPLACHVSLLAGFPFYYFRFKSYSSNGRRPFFRSQLNW